MNQESDLENHAVEVESDTEQCMENEKCSSEGESKHPVTKSRFFCNVCKKEFKNKQNLKKSLYDSHGGETIQLRTVWEVVPRGLRL